MSIDGFFVVVDFSKDSDEVEDAFEELDALELEDVPKRVEKNPLAI